MPKAATRTSPSLTDVAIARPSSTVVLARDADDGPEVFMVRRHAGSSFGSAFAFPGGVVDDTDCEVWHACTGVSPEQADRRLGIPAALDYFVAAIRELFEEVGVLLADTSATADELESARVALNAGSLGWNEFVAQHGVRMHCDRLRYFSFWITPEVKTKRYSTRFFLAGMPPGQVAVHDDGELTDSRWVSAGDALEARKAGEMLLHFPTIHTLRHLAALDSVAGMLDWADDRAAGGIEAILPVIRERDGRRQPVIEGDDD